MGRDCTAMAYHCRQSSGQGKRGKKIARKLRKAISETTRRRQIQEEFNRENNITPTTIVKAISDILGSVYESDYVTIPIAAEPEAEYFASGQLSKMLADLKREMREAAEKLEFERAADLRDRIRELQQMELTLR